MSRKTFECVQENSTFSPLFAPLLLKVTLRWTSQMLQADWVKGRGVVTTNDEPPSIVTRRWLNETKKDLLEQLSEKVKGGFFFSRSVDSTGRLLLGNICKWAFTSSGTFKDSPLESPLCPPAGLIL